MKVLSMALLGVTLLVLAATVTFSKIGGAKFEDVPFKIETLDASELRFRLEQDCVESGLEEEACSDMPFTITVVRK